MAGVRAAAIRSGVSAASWLGDVGVSAASAGRGPAVSWGPVMQDLMGLRSELMEARRVLTNVGGNLNDVARHANSTGAVHEATDRVLGLVERVVGRVEGAALEVGSLTAAARREHLRGRS